MRPRTSLFAVVPMLVATACSAKNDSAALTDTSAPAAATAADTGAVRQTIESANAKFLDALKRGDTTTAVSNYADDAIVMMPNEGSWRGQDGVRRGFAGFLSQVSVKDAKLNTENVIVGGDLAVETGTYEWTLLPKGGKESKDKGKYMTVWKRNSGGSWKIVRDINNTDLPART